MKYLVTRIVEADNEQEAMKAFRYGVGTIHIWPATHYAVIGREKLLKGVQKLLGECEKIDE